MWSENDYRTPGDGSPRPPGGQERVPDKILNQMSKQSGNSPKPFAYITGGIDLKEFRKKNRSAPPVMPKAYKGPNVEEQQAQQPQMHVVKGHHPPPDKYIAYSAGTPEPAKDLQNSEVLKMIQASENQGKRVISPEPETKVDTGFIRGQNYGMSFKVLQWMTETDKDNDASEDVNEQCKQQPRKTGKQRNPLMRHNSEDDEMRFSGLNKKTDIPSKTFMMLNKMSVNDDQYPPQVHVQGPDNEDQDDEEQVGRYDQKSIRYMGKNIPSPSFRLLQSLAKEDENARNNLKPTTTYSEDDLSQDDDDGLPDTLSGDENPRYMGSHIPSKSFKYLQHSIGQDENEAIQNVQHRPKARHTDVTEEHEEPTSGDENPRYMGSHIPSKSFRYLQMSIGQDENQQRQKPEPQRQEEPQQKRSLKIITTSRAVNPTEEETPSTDF